MLSLDCWVKAGWKKTDRCNVDEGYIQPIMAWVKQQGWWDVNGGGADHIIAHPMDFGDDYYTETSRAAMNSSIYLVAVGDNRPPPYSSHYRHYPDIVNPSSTADDARRDATTTRIRSIGIGSFGSRKEEGTCRTDGGETSAGAPLQDYCAGTTSTVFARYRVRGRERAKRWRKAT
jgi:hypothetical protein